MVPTSHRCRPFKRERPAHLQVGAIDVRDHRGWKARPPIVLAPLGQRRRGYSSTQVAVRYGRWSEALAGGSRCCLKARRLTATMLVRPLSSPRFRSRGVRGRRSRRDLALCRASQVGARERTRSGETSALYRVGRHPQRPGVPSPCLSQDGARRHDFQVRSDTKARRPPGSGSDPRFANS